MILHILSIKETLSNYMLFLLATPEYNNLQSNTTKVRVHLRNGVAEVFDQHQDLMGKVDNNIIEIETNFENRIEKNFICSSRCRFYCV